MRNHDYMRTLGRSTFRPRQAEIEAVIARIERREEHDADEVVVSCRWAGIDLGANGEPGCDRYEVTWGTRSPEGCFAMIRTSLYLDPIRPQRRRK